jgi:peptidyl-prolyl cis-trans isomerase D
MRKVSSNWVGKTIMSVVMGVLIISFGVWGIADIFRGFGQSTLATIGHTDISTDQFRQLYTDRLQQIGRQFGRPLTMDQARAFGFDRQVLQQTIAEAALDEDARRLGLGQSDEETKRLILSDPNFKGANGAFDPARFAAAMQQFGYSEARYVAEQRKVSLRRQIAGTISAGVQPSNLMIDALSRFQNEQRSVDYVRLDAAQAGTIDPPSPETLAGYFDEHKIQFRAPEYRKIVYVPITPEEIAKWADVADDDARKLYEVRKDTLGTPEKREVSQIVFPTMEEAAAARTRIESGTSFDDIAKERGLQPSDVELGSVSKSEVIDPEVAKAAFAAETGDITQPVQGKFGVTLAKIGKIDPGNQVAYESVAQKLKQEIATERARKSVADFRDKMEDERGGGARVIEAAKKLGLRAVTIDAVDRSGRRPDGQLVNDIPRGLDVVTQAFSSDVGVDNDPITFNGGYVWYDVLGITPSRERNLDEVKDQVEAKWRDDQIATKLRAKGADMVQKLDQGGKLTELAGADGLKVETATGFKREATPPGVPAGLIAAAFRTAKDGAGQTAGASDGQWIVFRVTDVSVPPLDMASDDVKKMKEQLGRSLEDEGIAQYVTKLETNIGTSINEAAFAQVTGASSSNNN